MSRFSQSLQIFAALLGLIAVSGGSAFGAATIEWVDPLPAAPEASAPLPPRQTTSQLPPQKARPGARLQESVLPLAPQGSFRPPMPGGRPSRPSPENSALAERASKFINSYWGQSSASGDEALRYLSSVYAPVVNYYGQQRTRDSVLQDKHAFLGAGRCGRLGPRPRQGTQRYPVTEPGPSARSPAFEISRRRVRSGVLGRLVWFATHIRFASWPEWRISWPRAARSSPQVQSPSVLQPLFFLPVEFIQLGRSPRARS